jgi:hypothetical protein
MRVYLVRFVDGFVIETEARNPFHAMRGFRTGSVLSVREV